MISVFRCELDEHYALLCYYHYWLLYNPEQRNAQDGCSETCWLKEQEYPNAD
jgi:hypothetical protein